VQLQNSFEVDASVEATWRLLNDVPAVVPCMPGAELVGGGDDETWKAKLEVKLGPISLQFLTDVRREEADEAERRIVLAARAREARGRGNAQATIESRLAEANGGTRVEITTDVRLQGVVAQYGRGVIGEVAARMIEQFAACVERKLGSSQPA
jgi:carbon monoxide dehydrogenase subunit G